MFDPNAILGQVQTGMAPSNWHVLRARRAYFVQSAVSGFVIAVLAIAATVYILSSGTVFGYGLNDQTPENVAFFWFIVDMVVLAAFLIGGIIFAILRLVAMRSAENQVLVLMPEGFVMRTGTSAKATRTVLYQNVATMVPTTHNGSVSLVMRLANGRKAQVGLDSRFEKPKALAQQIQGMHAAYASAAANARRG